MSSTAYVHYHTLTRGHAGTINVLAFSPDSQYLASGSDDRSVIIWNVPSGKSLYRFSFESRVDSLLWHPRWEETLIVACESGSLQQVYGFSMAHYGVYDINLGVRSHIYCLDFHPSSCLLAAGVGPEVHMTREISRNQYACASMRLPEPAANTDMDDPRYRAVALKFNEAGGQLIVTYLSHGIVCWDISTRQSIWRLVPPTTDYAIGHSAISPDYRQIVVHNFQDGLQQYAIKGKESPHPMLKYLFDTHSDSKLALQVAFLHHGRAVISGTSTGRVCIWETASGDYFQQLPHDGDTIVAVTGCQRGEFSYVATGAASKGAETYIKIWRAKIAGLSTPQYIIARATLYEVLMRSWHIMPCLSADDTQKIVSGIVVTVVSLLIPWALYRMSLLIPWNQVVQFSVIQVCHYG
ncbi:WD40-repeat-containing domain protein [Fomitopsis serialis]|uniref:WD40-repeat-containing domain protein n=1 Tax=Fomitopsis serialis TaxID=139415 RepID=UPI0020075B45|nr:WD40-repeat-containing domain protein [Neoantrodia serialis]KAH9931483.1 WD40-repeat-containing domain protein [Neoantrodia serialis]